MKAIFKNNWMKMIVILLFLLFLLFFFGMPYFNNVMGPDNDRDDVRSGDTRIAAVGDSITYDLYVAASEDDFYPQQLDELLGEGYAVHNFGVSNYAAQSSSDFPYDTTEEYQESLDFNPEIVIIMLGTNDTKETNWNGVEQFKEEYEELLESYLDLASVSRIILASPPAAFLEGEAISGSIDPDIMTNVGDAVEEIAEEHNLEFVDVYEETAGHPEYFPDGIHPDEEGSEALAEVFYQQIVAEED